LGYKNPPTVGDNWNIPASTGCAAGFREIITTLPD